MARGKPGIMIKYPDDERIFIQRNEQPLKEKGKIILEILNSDYKPVLTADNKQSTLLMDISVYNERASSGKLIGYID